MSSDFDQNSDNDLPEWMQGMGDEDENTGLGAGDPFSSQSSEDEDVPEWLADIRSAENTDGPTFMDEDVPDEDTEDWLESIRERHQAETDILEKSSGSQEDDSDYMDKIRQLKASDENGWGTPDEEASGWDTPDKDDSPEENEIAAAWMSDTEDLPNGAEDDEEEDVPDWLSGLPSLDPVEPEPIENTANDQEQDDLPHVAPLSDPPPNTGTLPSWLENLQTSGLVLPDELKEDKDEDDEDYDSGFDISDEDVSNVLSEAEDLPDWLGENVAVAEEEQEEEFEPETPSLFTNAASVPAIIDEEIEETEDTEIEKAELPTWLQAMRPVETILPTTDSEEEDEDAAPREREKVGPLSGLRDVLPAEPHVVHFGEGAKPVPGFSLTAPQQRYAKLLKSLVSKEAESPPAVRRSVALPQQILRWVIGIVLVAVLIFVLFFRVNLFAMPTTGIPQENLAVSNAVNTLAPGARVLVAFEYQPALSGEMESVSAGIIHHLLSRQVNLVLFSSQPTGPGLADAFLQQDYLAGLNQQQVVNLGYLSGGSAALLNFAANPRRAMPAQDTAGQNLWDQTPLAGINTIKDFALVLVITDDPDTARSWVEQVYPLLDPNKDGTGTPLVMAVSAQAEPLVYPYYLTSPHQISGYVSGLAGGAFYETHNNTPVVANRYWNAYNVGLLLTVLVIGLGAVYNLVRQTFLNTGREKA